MEEAYDAGLAALVSHGDTYDTLRDLVKTVIDASAPVLMKHSSKDQTLDSIQDMRRKFIAAIAAQLRLDAELGRGSETGFYDGEITRAADYLETYLSNS